ncbi:hypothetical protein [Peristeroidobacter agariperforans]|uniref:hypothetical protein n=1 Tax=Peristeroidobacter agariperforans TaxID=268404 RepID=UPI00101CED87|nr:hypothetical protein [Peristeroidobacter agariperforans]
MIYCITNQMSYSSSLNIFTVVAGIFLVRGSLDTARIVTWFSAFMLSGFLLGSLIISPWLQPLEYWLITFREDPLSSLGSMVLLPAVLFMLFWVYRELRSPPVLEARATAGHKSGAPRLAFLAGSVLAVVMAVMLQLTLKGESAEKAVRLAAEQHGAEYRYFVSSINWAGRHVSARLTAYNDKETKEVAVEWER